MLNDQEGVPETPLVGDDWNVLKEMEANRVLGRQKEDGFSNTVPDDSITKKLVVMEEVDMSKKAGRERVRRNKCYYDL
jgi:hypothetical protein